MLVSCKPLMLIPRFNEDPEKFYQRAKSDSEKSHVEFNKPYEGCPYNHTPREVPEEVMEILEDNSVAIYI